MSINLRSSHISHVDYIPGSLTVTFKKGGTYIYHGVTMDDYQGLLKAASPGSYLNRRIKGVYKFTKKSPVV